MKRLLNIHRIDNDANRTHAWLVTVQRKTIIVNKMFSDHVWGGKRKALQAAVDFRAELLAQVPEYDYYFHIRSTIRRNNKSGMAGVGRYESIDNPKTGRRVVFWLASWTDEQGVQHRRKYSVLRYGERKAKQLAIAERERRLKEVCEAKCAESAVETRFRMRTERSSGKKARGLTLLNKAAS